MILQQLSFIDIFCRNSKFKIKICYSKDGDYMDIYYRNKILFVNIDDELTKNNVNIMQKRIFRIIEDYDIDNIVLKHQCNNSNLLTPFVTTYNKKHNGNLKII